MKRILGYLTFSIVFIILHTTLIKFFSIRDIVPDILIVCIGYVAIREGQVAGTISGFLIGLALDLLSGQDGMLGLSALSKTVAGFTAGYFYNENKVMQTLGSYVFIIVIGVSAFVHNILYFTIFLQGTTLGVWEMMLRYGIPATLYTAAVSLLPMFAFARKYLS